MGISGGAPQVPGGGRFISFKEDPPLQLFIVHTLSNKSYAHARHDTNATMYFRVARSPKDLTGDGASTTMAEPMFTVTVATLVIIAPTCRRRHVVSTTLKVPLVVLPL